MEVHLLENRKGATVIVPDALSEIASKNSHTGTAPPGVQGARQMPEPPAFYHPSSGIDLPAQLVGEWYVLSDLWPGDVRKIQVRLWISAEGNIDRWKVLEPSSSEKVSCLWTDLGPLPAKT
jgi:hypothetical protein